MRSNYCRGRYEAQASARRARQFNGPSVRASRSQGVRGALEHGRSASFCETGALGVGSGP
jgi:hypothetical protein